MPLAAIEIAPVPVVTLSMPVESPESSVPLSRVMSEHVRLPLAAIPVVHWFVQPVGV